MGVIQGARAIQRRVLDSRLMQWKNIKGYRQLMPKPDDEIVISMSSGVDSSVTALMFSQMYKNVRGVFMANWSSEKIIGANSQCPQEQDWVQVQETCKQLGISCSRVNFEKEYWNHVFEPMLEAYERGETPNPDIGCNKHVKFGQMIHHLNDYYGEQKNWWLVTGHYARILQNESNNEFNLFRSDYKPKDQSYYLTSIPQNVLSRVIMPIGHYSKPQIREIANSYNLLTKDKPDSQGLCFVSQEGHFKDFLNQYIQPKPGNIVTRDGKIWGQHGGLWQATIGQRSGISMPQGDEKYKGVWMICDKDIERNELIIARKDDQGEFWKRQILIDVNSWYWISSMNWEKLKNVDNINCQIRSLQKPNFVKKWSIEGGTLKIDLNEDIFAIAPGQTLALYQDDLLLGSGRIIGSK